VSHDEAMDEMREDVGEKYDPEVFRHFQATVTKTGRGGH
jgi:HD-GYP domain-containing protein (c-di-GMP phosphodiesterase class II)